MRSKSIVSLAIACALLTGCADTTPAPAATATSAEAVQYRDIEVHIGDYAPVDPETARDAIPGEREWTTPDGGTVYLARALTIRGSDIQSATASTQDGAIVDFVLTPAGGTQLQAVTADSVGKVLGIVVDERLVSAATVRMPFGDRFQLSAITANDATALVRQLEIAPSE